MKSSQLRVNWECFSTSFSQKQSRSFEFQVFQIFLHDDSNNSLKEANNYFENHPSVVNIKRKGFDSSFTLGETRYNEAIKLIKTFKVSTTVRSFWFYSFTKTMWYS